MTTPETILDNSEVRAELDRLNGVLNAEWAKLNAIRVSVETLNTELVAQVKFTQMLRRTIYEYEQLLK